MSAYDIHMNHAAWVDVPLEEGQEEPPDAVTTDIAVHLHEALASIVPSYKGIKNQEVRYDIEFLERNDVPGVRYARVRVGIEAQILLLCEADAPTYGLEER